MIPFSSLKGPCKDTIDAINKQMDVHFEEIRKLRSAHNSHVPVSRLPAELLSEVFLCIVESSLPYLASGFARGTFMFRQVCRHWDEVAVGFPQLWVQWLSRAVRAWPLFNTRSKEAPIFLKWQPYHAGEDLPADTVLPGRIRQLEFIGTREQSEKLFRAVDSSAPSNASSIRIYITSHPTQDTEKDTQAHLARFLSSPLPKLSKLNITNYQPDCSSAAFTTSSLTSLRLSFPAGARPRYTLAQFSRILQKHPNLRGLDLEDAAVPQVESTEAPVPFTLPQLDVLKLRGTPECILRVVYLIGTTSPLHHIALHFDLTRDQDVPASVDAVKKVLTAYYEHGGLDHPRRANHITVSGAQSGPLCFIARSQSTPGPSPQPLLELRFSGGDKLMEILPLFPLKDTQEFTINGLLLTSNEYYRLLQQVEGVSQLRLSGLDIKPVLKALYSRNRGVLKGATDIMLSH